METATATKKRSISYKFPHKWIKYDLSEVANTLLDAKAVMRSLQNIPYQRSWVEGLQELELKREVAGTSQIEGADFTEYELEEAISGEPEELKTRSQRQVRAALRTYRWIATLDADLPVDEKLICHVHRQIVTESDDDHCPPGKLRTVDQNVTFGSPKHRGVIGGPECAEAFAQFVVELNTSFESHDPIIQALAAHYHFAAMHPFLDGNGRTARALEALMLQRAGLKDTCFIAMSNYYYDEKPSYLAALSEVRAQDHDLTPFLLFGLKGVAIQTQRLLNLIRKQTQKLLFRDTMQYFSDRLLSPRKRAITKRQFEILQIMLEQETTKWRNLQERVWHNYENLKQPRKGIIRDMSFLLDLGALTWEKREEDEIEKIWFRIDLEWPTKITETDFYKKLRQLPRAKSSFPSIR